MLVWLRLSTMKQLDWYRNSSYQSKDIAHVQKTITQRFADKVSTCMGRVPAPAANCLQTCRLPALCHASSYWSSLHISASQHVRAGKGRTCCWVTPGVSRSITAANSRPPNS